MTDSKTESIFSFDLKSSLLLELFLLTPYRYSLKSESWRSKLLLLIKESSSEIQNSISYMDRAVESLHNSVLTKMLTAFVSALPSTNPLSPSSDAAAAAEHQYAGIVDVTPSSTILEDQTKLEVGMLYLIERKRDTGAMSERNIIQGNIRVQVPAYTTVRESVVSIFVIFLSYRSEQVSMSF